MKVLQVLGTGCPKCNKLAETAEDAARKSGVEYQLEKITNIERIMQMGVMMTPALVIDGVVKVVGRVPTEDEIQNMLKS